MVAQITSNVGASVRECGPSVMLNRQISGIVESNRLPSDELLDLHYSSIKKDNSSIVTDSNNRAHVMDHNEQQLPSLRLLKGNLRGSGP